MRWLDIHVRPRFLHCPYCSAGDEFPSVRSYEHGGEMFTLYACTSCGSLTYGLQEAETPDAPSSDAMSYEAAHAARYVLECGFSSHYVALCGLASAPDAAADPSAPFLFVDVGAGMGLATYFAKYILGLDTLTIEPSYTGSLCAEIFGFEVHRAYFEALPCDVMDGLAGKRCLLHLNSVVEHLADPGFALGKMMSSAPIERAAIIVPDGDALDFSGPFASALPFLAPRDHRHLPTACGMEHLLRGLGFEFQAVQRTSGLLIAVGSRTPVSLPGEREIRLAETALLESLIRHPNPQVSAGGASRLLPGAVMRRDDNLLSLLRRQLPYESQCDRLLAALAAPSWADGPTHLGPTCYWLAYTAFAAGRLEAALALLDITRLFAERVAETFPSMALAPLEFKWAGLLLRAHVLAAGGSAEAARLCLLEVTSSAADKQNGARQPIIDQAAGRLRELLPSREPPAGSPRYSRESALELRA